MTARATEGTKADARAIWLARVGTVFLRALATTWRVRVVNPEVVRAEHDRRQPVILALWHGQLLPLLWVHRNREIAIIISEHADGEIIARAAASLGCRAVRGSSSRGAARALLGATRELEAGYDLAITPDGPRGPAKSVAPGTMVIAQRSGAPVVPVAAVANRSWRLRSWDSFMIPKPFATVTVAYSDPIRVVADTARDAMQEAESVRAGIDRAEATAAS